MDTCVVYAPDTGRQGLSVCNSWENASGWGGSDTRLVLEVLLPTWTRGLAARTELVSALEHLAGGASWWQLEACGAFSSAVDVIEVAVPDAKRATVFGLVEASSRSLVTPLAIKSTGRFHLLDGSPEPVPPALVFELAVPETQDPVFGNGEPHDPTVLLGLGRTLRRHALAGPWARRGDIGLWRGQPERGDRWVTPLVEGTNVEELLSELRPFIAALGQEALYVRVGSRARVLRLEESSWGSVSPELPLETGRSLSSEPDETEGSS